MSRLKGFAIAAVAAVIPVIGLSQGMMGGNNAMPNGTGMVVVASDGSLLVTQMGMSMMGGPGEAAVLRCSAPSSTSGPTARNAGAHRSAWAGP